MSTWRRNLALVFGAIECVLFGGTLIGWSSLVYVLKQDGVFWFLCNHDLPPEGKKTCISGTPCWNQEDTGSNMTTDPRQNFTGADDILATTEGFMQYNTSGSGDKSNSCPAEDHMLSLAFTISLVLIGLLATPLGWIFDRYGLRYTRLLGSLFAVFGYSMMAFTGKYGVGWLVFPGTSLIALSCVTIIMTNCHICLLAGRHAFTCIAVYNGAINTGVVVFLLCKILHDVGFPTMYFMLCVGGVWLVLVLPSTFLLLPKFKVEPDSSNQGGSSSSTNMAANTPRGSLAVIGSLDEETENSREPTPVTSSRLENTEDEQSLRHNVFSANFLLYLLWYTVLYVRIQMFVVSFNAWITELVDGDLDAVSYFTNVFGYAQLSVVVVTPLAGIYMDRKRKQISKSSTYRSASNLARRGTSCVPSLTVASLSAILLSSLVLVPSLTAVYLVMVIAEVCRAFLYATAIAYIDIMFPGSQYGRLFGVSYLVSGAAVFLQYPLFLWAEGHSGGFNQVNLLLLVLVSVTLIHPIYLLVSWYRQRQLAIDT